MRTLSMVALIALVALGTAVSALPAQAGGWAVTLLDPLPERFEAGHSYTIGYWVLQHGSHPYEGELGRTGLRLVGPGSGPDTQELVFDAVALREPAHYAVAIAVPTSGTWRVHAMQGWFDEHDVGTLTVPGALAIKPPDGPVSPGAHSHDGTSSHWGAVHPPGSATEGHNHDHAPPAPAAAPANQGAGQDVANAATVAPQQGSPPLLPALLVLGVVVVLLGIALGARPMRRRLRG